MEPNSAGAWKRTGLWRQSSPPASPPHPHQHQGEVNAPGSQGTQPHPCLRTEPCHSLKSVKRVPPFFFFLIRLEKQRIRNLGGEGLGVKVSLAGEYLWGQAKLGSFISPAPRLAYSQQLPAFLKDSMQKFGVPKLLSFKKKKNSDLYKTFVTLERPTRK